MTTDESEGLSGVSSQAASEPPVGSASTTTTSQPAPPSSGGTPGQLAARASAEVVAPSPPITIIDMSALPVRGGRRCCRGIVDRGNVGGRRITGLDVGGGRKQDDAHDVGSRHSG